MNEHEGVKQALRSAERLRAIGVAPFHGGHRWHSGVDSWDKTHGQDKRQRERDGPGRGEPGGEDPDNDPAAGVLDAGPS